MNMNVKLLSSEAFFSQRYSNSSAAGFGGVSADTLGELTAHLRPLAGLRGPTSKGRRGG